MDNEKHVPTVTLAGREWPVPVLAPKQNRIVVPALLEILPRIAQIRDAAASGGTAELARHLDTATYDRLTEIVFVALTRARPEIQRAEFDDLPIETIELMTAIHVIARQAGLLAPAAV